MPAKRKRSLRTAIPADVHVRPSSDDAHDILYFRRHKNDDPEQAIPAQEFLLERCPRSVMIKLSAILTQVAAAPPKRFSGGGYWEAMTGLDKPFRTELSDSDYAAVRALGNEYLARNPRSLA